MPSADPPHPGRLFIVDDDAHVLSSLRFALEADGYEVVTLTSGEALIETSPSGARDCIIIDQRLQGLSGLETLSRLRGNGIRTPAILITTNPSRNVRRIADDAAIEIVEKPLLGNALPQKILEVLSR